MNEGYELAFSEMLCIINHSREEEKSKIPKSFIEFLIKHSNKEYNPEFDFSNDTSVLNLRKETKCLLSLVYLSYLANDEEKEEFNKLLEENEEKYQKIKAEKYDIYKVFEKRKSIDNEVEEKEEIDKKQTSMVEYKQESIFRKIINKIIKFFKRR